MAASPDHVVVGVEIAHLAPSPDAAYREAAQRSEAFEVLVGELGIDRAARTTTGVTVEEHLEHDHQGRAHHRGFRAANRLSFTLDDPALAGRLLAEAATRARARVSGPWWRIGFDNAARVEACRRAAENARTKGEAYAGALGLRLGAVVDASEPGVGAEDTMRMRAMAGHFAMAEPEIRVDPGQLDVTAHIDVRFALEQP